MSLHIPLRFRHWNYVWIPILTALVWFATLLAMLVTWLAMGRPKYPTQTGNIAYISDIGESNLKPLFIVGCTITGFGFFLCLVCVRYLRYTGQLIPNLRTRERVFSVLAIICSLIGGFGLLFLSILDAKHFPNVHNKLLLLFIVCVCLSVIFSVIEYRWLSQNFKDSKQLKCAYIAKGVIGFSLIICAIVFGITYFLAHEVGAVIEWFIAFSYTFYLLTFWYDLWLSKNIEKGKLKVRYGSRVDAESGSDVDMIQVTEI